MNETLQPHTDFASFYPFYLGEHLNPICRSLHFVGTSLSLGCLLQLVLTGTVAWLFAGLFTGYFCAWVGHFVFEKNKPASFKQPLYSFMGDWVMWFELLTGKIPFNPKK